MDANFWHNKWERNEIAFHANETNPLFVKYYNELALESDSRVFLPLCGKTQDIPWLLSKGYNVAGAELSQLAIEQLFADLGMQPSISPLGKLLHYSANNIDIFVGDIFDLSSQILGQVDAVYDRAALVALPYDMRTRYTAHLMEITNNAPQLLICYEYDQNDMEGPPFSISTEEIDQHYRSNYELILRGSNEVTGGLRGQCLAKENVWVLKSKS